MNKRCALYMDKYGIIKIHNIKSKHLVPCASLRCRSARLPPTFRWHQACRRSVGSNALQASLQLRSINQQYVDYKRWQHGTYKTGIKGDLGRTSSEKRSKIQIIRVKACCFLMVMFESIETPLPAEGNKVKVCLTNIISRVKRTVVLSLYSQATIPRK